MALSTSTIDNLVEVMVNRQERINASIIYRIARRIKEIGHLLPSDVYKLERLLKTGSDVKLINQELAKLTALQVDTIKKLIKDVAVGAYLDTKPFYDYRQLPFIPFEQNTNLQRVVKAIERQTSETYVNLSKAQAYMIRDLKNPKRLVPTPLSQTYQTIIDEAVQASQSGIIDYNTAMRRSMQQLIDSGLRTVEYQAESGRLHTQEMGAAVRRNVLDGIRAINQGVQDVTGEQFGADGKEITVHSYPAPDHCNCQGHQFTNAEWDKIQSGEDFKDIQGRRYIGFPRKIGTLNCRHFAYSIIIGHASQNYTDEQLQNILDANEKGYTMPNGKHLTMYECTQKQREYERRIRKAKTGQKAALEAGDDALAAKYNAQIDRLNKEYISFSKACGLKPKMQKTTIS